MNTKDKGILTETAIIFDLVKKGYVVSLPYGDNAPYDLIVQYKNNNKLIRIQCRTARYKNGAMQFKTSQTRTNLNGWITTTSKGFDWYAIYNKDINRCFYVKLDGIRKCSMTLRIEASLSNKVKNINFAQNYKTGPN